MAKADLVAKMEEEERRKRDEEARKAQKAQEERERKQAEQARAHQREAEKKALKEDAKSNRAAQTYAASLAKKSQKRQAELETDARKRAEEQSAQRSAAQQAAAQQQAAQQAAAQQATAQQGTKMEAAPQPVPAAERPITKAEAQEEAKAWQAARDSVLQKLQNGQKLQGDEADFAYDIINEWLEDDENRAAYNAVKRAVNKGGDWAARLYESDQFDRRNLDEAKIYQEAYKNLGLGTKLKGRIGDTAAGTGMNIAGSIGLTLEALEPLVALQTAANEATQLGRNLNGNEELQDAANQKTQDALQTVMANENPIDQSGWAYQTWLKSQQLQQRGALGLTDGQKMLQGAATSAAENMALAAINPALVMPTLTMQATGGSVGESAERGDSLAKTIGKAASTGAVSALIEKLPTDELMRNLGVKSGAAEDALIGVLRQAGAEGLEEFIESYADTTLDAAFGDEEWTKLLSAQQLQEAAQAGLQGGLAGGMMGGGARLMSQGSYEAAQQAAAQQAAAQQAAAQQAAAQQAAAQQAAAQQAAAQQAAAQQAAAQQAAAQQAAAQQAAAQQAAAQQAAEQQAEAQQAAAQQAAAQQAAAQQAAAQQAAAQQAAAQQAAAQQATAQQAAAQQDAQQTQQTPETAAQMQQTPETAAQMQQAAAQQAEAQQTAAQEQDTPKTLDEYEQQIKDYRQAFWNAEFGMEEYPDVPVIPRTVLEQMPEDLVPQEIWDRASGESESVPAADAQDEWDPYAELFQNQETAPAGSTDAEKDILQSPAKGAARSGTDVWEERMAELFGGGKQMQQAFERGAALQGEKGKVTFDQRSVLRDDKTAAKLLDINSRTSGLVTEVREKLENNAYGAVEVQLGRMLVSDEAQADLVGTLLHEDYHWFSSWNREGGADLAKTMMEYMAQTHGSETVDALVQDYLDRYAQAGQQLTYAQAVEEMTGDALRGIFDSEKSLRNYIKFCQDTSSDRSTSAWNGPQRVLKALRDFIDRVQMKLKEYLKIDPDNEAARMASELCEERKEQLRQMYREYVEGAMDIMDETGKTTEAKTDAAAPCGIDGKPIDPERISGEEGNVRYSLKHNDEIAAGQRAYLNGKKSNVTEQELEDAQEVTAAMVDVMMRYSNILPEDKIGKVLTKNGSYDRSVENTTICVRTLAYNEFVDKVQEQLGRPLTQMESFLVSQKLYDIATEPQCMYCYVSLDRKAYNEMLLRYMSDRDTVIEKYRKSDRSDAAKEALYEEFLHGRKSTKEMRGRFDAWIGYVDNGTKMLTLADIATEERQSEVRAGGGTLAAQLADARKYAQSASWSKIQKNYVAYRDEILKLGDRVVKNLNEHYGLRWYSFSDYSAAFIVENMQQITDAAIRGLKGLAYTKDTDFAEIFAPSGMNINVSVFVKRDANGNFVIDERQSADFETAKRLRDKYPNVGIVATVTDDEALRWAASQEWSDVIIPFHIVRTGTDVAEYYKWLNYTSESGDTVRDKNLWDAYVNSLNVKSDAAKKKVSKNIYPSEHHNDRDTYLGLCESRGLTPRFERFKTEPWYMKLVNETRLSADESKPIKPTFNEDAAKASFEKFVKKGGYEGGWYREGVDVDAEVRAVAEDVRAGKKANEVSYGRQDGFDPEALIAGRKENRKHGQGEQVTRRYQLKPNESSRQAVAERKLGITLAKLADGVYGVDENTRVQRVDEASGALLRKWNSKTDRRALNDRLGQLFSQSRPDMTEAEAREECRRVAGFVLDGATRQNRALWDQYPKLHNQSLTVPKDSQLMRELTDRYGSYAEAQKEASKHGVTLRQGSDAMPWDKLQRELHGEYPNYFNGEATTGTDLLQQMMDAYDAIKPWQENQYADSYEDAAEELSEKLYQAYEQSDDPNIRSLLESAPADESEEVTALREQLQSMKQRQAEQRYTGKNSEAMERLKRSWNKLYQMYMRPTETSHIPNVGGLREMTGELLTLLDPGSMGVDRDGVMLKSAEEFEKKIKLVQERLAESKQNLDKGKNGELGDYLSGTEYAEVREALDTLSDILSSENAYENVTQYSGHTARQMTLEARGACINVMTLLETKIRDANRSLTAGFARDMAKMRLDAAGEVSTGEVHKWLGNAASERNAKYTEYLSPQRMFNRLGGYRKNGTLNRMYNLLNDAAVDTESYKQKGNEFFGKLAEKEGVLKQFALKAAGKTSKAAGLSLFTGKNAEKLTVKANLIDGSVGEVTVNRAILANMVDVWKHNQEEVETSGFTIPNLKLYYEGKTEDAYAQGTQVYPTKKQLQSWEQMCSTGTAVDWMEALTKYEGWISPIKASVQEAVDGFTNINNKDHRTIYRDQDFIVSDSDADMRDSALRHFGFTKYRQKGAIHPIRAMDITDYAAKQVKDDSIYCGMTKAVRDFTKIYDGKLVSAYKDENGRRRSTPSLKALISKHYGQVANDYIKNLLQDLKGTPRAGGSPMIDKMLGNLAGSALSMNFYSTPVKQLSGFWAGASVVGMKHMLGTVAQKNRKYALSAEEIAKYTPLLAIREAEGGSPEMAALRSKKGLIGRVNEHLPGSLAIGKMDSWVIERMWGAAAAKVHEESPDLGENTEEFKRATAKVFNRCVQETQSNNLVLQRSEILRSKNAMYRILGQFKSQPMVNGNLILDAWAGLQANKDRSKAEQEAAKKQFVNTMVSQAATVLTDVALINLVRAIMHQYGPWKDEDEEITVQSVLSCLIGDGVGSITGMVPGLDILTDLMSGYDYSNVTTDMVNDLKDAFVDVYKAVDKYRSEEETTLSETAQACIKPMCTGLDAFGIPASGTRRVAEAFGKFVSDIAAKEFDIDGKAGAYSTDLYGQLFAQREELDMSGAEVQEWYRSFGGKRDDRPTANKKVDFTYYQNRSDDDGAAEVDESLNEMYLELFADYKEQGMDASDAHTAAAKVLPAKELTEVVSLPDADGDGKAEKVTLTAQQVIDYAEAKTEAGYDLYEQLFDSNYSAEQKAEIAAKVDDYADAVAVHTVLEEDPSEWFDAVFDAIENGASELDALAMVLFAEDVKGDKTADGKTVTGSRLQNQLDYLKGQKIANSQKAAILAGEMSDTQRKVYDKAVDAGVDTWAAAQFVVYRAVTGNDKDAKGETVTGSELKKEVEYIKKMNCTNKQKAALAYECLSDAKQDYYDQAVKAGADPWVTAQYLVFCATLTTDRNESGKIIRTTTEKAKDEIKRLGVKGKVAEIYLEAAKR